MDVRQINGPVKLNVGCGGRRLPGYIGVDVVADRPAVDIVAPAGKIPLPDGCAEEIMSIHCIEHVYPWELPDILKEWNRILQPGGRLILELPDIVKACQNLISGIFDSGKHPNQLSYWAIFGDDRLKDPFMMHKFGYCFKTLSPIVAAAGFTGMKEKPTQFHPVGRFRRDFRLEARKPENE